MILDDEAKQILAVCVIILLTAVVIVAVRVSNYKDFDDACLNKNGYVVQAATEKLCMRDGDVLYRE